MNKKGHEGIEPSSSGWKPEIITSIRMPHVVGEVGFEPTKHKVTDLQSACFNLLHTRPNSAYISRRT